MNHSSKVKLSDVAQACGLSTASVSFILNNDIRYSFKASTIRKVRETAELLQYYASPAAVSLRTQKKRIIIGIMGYVSRDSDLELAVYFKQELYKRGFYLVIQFMADMEDQDKVDFFARICHWGAGIAIWSFGISENSSEYGRLTGVLANVPPALCFSYPMSGTEVDYISIAFGQNFDRVGAFFRNQGCKRIAYCLPYDNPAFVNNFLDQNEKFGMEMICLTVLPRGKSFWNFRAAGRFAAEELFKYPDQLPDGIYCFSDEMAVEIRQAFLLKYGQAPIIVGGGDMAFSRQLEPPLPVFVHNVRKQAALAAEYLVHRIQAGEDTPGTGHCIGVISQNLVIPKAKKRETPYGCKIIRRAKSHE